VSWKVSLIIRLHYVEQFFPYQECNMVFAQNSSILHWAVHQPIAFSQLWSLTRWFVLVTEELSLH